jgi:DNA-binding transcriptional LysR family regulator
MVAAAPPSLDHLRIFLTVVEEGSFNRAARKLGRAISVISYAVSTLEAQLGMSLFDREGSRRPVLTEAGKALVAEARGVTDGVSALMAKVHSLHQGLEAELSLAVDVMVPCAVTAQLLPDFQAMFPSVGLRLHVEALGAVAALVQRGEATLGIAGPEITQLPEIEILEIGAIELVPVAAPSHPLAQRRRIEPGETRRHLQLVLTDRSNLTSGRDFSVFSARTWRLADLGAKHALLKEGIGWGNMPVHLVADDLADGALVRLELPEHSRLDYRLIAVWRRDTPPGPAANWVLDEVRARLSQPRGLPSSDPAPK